LGLSGDFLLTSLIVVLVPGTGVIYTLSHGLFQGRWQSVVAACGCTLGIVPHLLVTIFGLAALLRVGGPVFTTVKFLGVAYIFYLAWGIWSDRGPLTVSAPDRRRGAGGIIVRGVLINLLNPKLSIFFLAFLPQFVPSDHPSPIPLMLLLSGVFIAMTLIVFVIYGLMAATLRDRVIGSPTVMAWLRYGFAAAFVALGVRLALVSP